MSEIASAHTRSAGGELGTRLAALAGIAFAVMFLIGIAVLNVPTKASDRELLQWWSSNSHQTDALVSMIAFTLPASSSLSSSPSSAPGRRPPKAAPER